MKKTIVLLLILLFTITSLGFTYEQRPVDTIIKGINEILNITAETLTELIKYAVDKFKDLKPTDWFINTVSKLIKMGGINGYPDGTFRPNSTITKAEFIKMTVGSLGYKEGNPKSGHWATNYIDRAEKLGLIDKGEYKTNEYDKPITRNEMIKITVRAVEYKGENIPSNYNDYKSYINDINSIPSKYKDYVLKGYAIGLIDGYEDGTFRGDKNLTRAEAATVIIRIFDENERVDAKKKGKDDSFIEPEFKIWYSTTNKDEYNYFLFRVTNYENYRGKGYTFKTECISHPQLNKWRRWNPIVQKVIDVDNILIYTLKNDSIVKRMGRIYELEDLRDVEGVTLKEGEKLKYKVTVTNGKTTKTYTLNAEFRDKKFRY